MSARKGSRKCLISYIVLFVLVFIIAAFTIVNRCISRHLSELCRYKCSEILNNILSDAASEAACKEQSYYIVTRDSSGKIQSVEADTSAVNGLESFLRKRVNERISSDDYDEVDFTLGDLTDIACFSGRGPDICIRFQRCGTADTKYETAFETAGINQTRLKVSVLVSVEFTAFLPAGEENFTVSEEFVASDTVIVGEVPDRYPMDISV